MGKLEHIFISMSMLVLITTSGLAQSDPDSPPILRQFQVPHVLDDVVTTNGYVYAISRQDRLLLQIDLRTGLLTNQWELNMDPYFLWLTATEQTLFVALSEFNGATNTGQGHIVVFDVATDQITNEISVDYGIRSITGTDDIMIISGGRLLQSRDLNGNILDSKDDEKFQHTKASLAEDNILYVGAPGRAGTELYAYELNPESGVLLPLEGDAHPTATTGVIPVLAGWGKLLFFEGVEPRTSYIHYVRNYTIHDFSYDPLNHALFTIADQGRGDDFCYYNWRSYVPVACYRVKGDFILVTHEETTRGVYVVSLPHTRTNRSQNPPNQTLFEHYENFATGASDNQPPVVSFSIPDVPKVDEPMLFDASASSDDEGITLYSWRVNDHVVLEDSQPILEYVFTVGGTYFIELQVHDRFNEIDSLSQTINVPIAASSDSDS